MKMIYCAILAVLLAGCASNPKIMMKNCTKIHDDYYECDEVPQRPMHEPHGRF
jgi:starvation-inducible outer membrane lipoprotein